MKWHVEDCNYKIVVFFLGGTPPQVASFLRDHFIHSSVAANQFFLIFYNIKEIVSYPGSSFP